MAKRKKSKQSSNNFSYSVELTGLILILIGIIGLGFGPIGIFIKQFAMFLSGEFWYVLLFMVIFLGLYMLFKRKLPKFVSTRLIGIYLILAILLSLAHFEFLKQTDSLNGLINESYKNYMERINTITTSTSLLESGDSSIVIGGGLVGAIIIGLLDAAFGQVGSIVVIIIVTIFASILALDITLADLFSKLFSGFKAKDEKPKEIKKEYVIEGDELVGIKEVSDNKTTEEVSAKEKIVITSIDELKNIIRMFK